MSNAVLITYQLAHVSWARASMWRTVCALRVRGVAGEARHRYVPFVRIDLRLEVFPLPFV